VTEITRDIFLVGSRCLAA